MEKNNAEIEGIVKDFVRVTPALPIMTDEVNGFFEEHPDALWGEDVYPDNILELDPSKIEKWLRTTLTTFKAHIEAALLEEIDEWAARQEVIHDQLAVEIVGDPDWHLGQIDQARRLRALITTRKEQIGK